MSLMVFHRNSPLDAILTRLLVSKFGKHQIFGGPCAIISLHSLSPRLPFFDLRILVIFVFLLGSRASQTPTERERDVGERERPPCPKERKEILLIHLAMRRTLERTLLRLCPLEEPWLCA